MVADKIQVSLRAPSVLEGSKMGKGILIVITHKKHT